MAELKTKSLHIQGKDWNISREKEVDEGGNESEVVMAKNGDIIHRFSPNITDEELAKFEEADDFNLE